jgi:hypothetical protein
MHRRMFESYFSERYATLRNLVDSSVTGEDMLMSLVHAESGGPVVAMSKWADRRHFMMHDRQTMGTLSFRTARSRPHVLNTFRKTRAAVACASCTWWDFRLQKPTTDPPHAASGVDDRTFRFNDSAFYTMKATMHPVSSLSNERQRTVTRMSCQELSDLFGIAHTKSWGTSSAAVRTEWMNQRCKTAPTVQKVLFIPQQISGGI